MFLLVPAHPGFPGQIPQSRKTVVCVCVLLCGYMQMILNVQHSKDATATLCKQLAGLDKVIASVHEPWVCNGRICGYSSSNAKLLCRITDARL